MRQEDQHAADAADDAFHQQAFQVAVGHVRRQHGAQVAHAIGVHFHRRGGPRKDGLEDQEHQHGQDDGAEDGVQHHVVDLFRQVAAVARVVADGGQDATHFALGFFDTDGIDGRQRFRFHHRQRQHGVDGVEQGFFAIVLHRDGFHHGHAQFGRQPGRVDDHAALARHVRHVQRQQHGQAQALDFQHQAQIQAQIGGVDDADDGVRARVAAAQAAHHVARDGFIGRGGRQAVGARQVEDAHGFTGRRSEMAFLAFDGHAGVVRHFLARARQTVEQGGLAAVRIAQQGNLWLMRRLVHARIDDCFDSTHGHSG